MIMERRWHRISFPEPSGLKLELLCSLTILASLDEEFALAIKHQRNYFRHISLVPVSVEHIHVRLIETVWNNPS